MKVVVSSISPKWEEYKASIILAKARNMMEAWSSLKGKEYFCPALHGCSYTRDGEVNCLLPKDVKPMAEINVKFHLLQGSNYLVEAVFGGVTRKGIARNKTFLAFELNLSSEDYQ